MVLSKRDQWIVTLLPMMLILFGYFWYGYYPLRKKSDDLSRKLRAHTMNSEGYRMQIRRAAKELEQAKKDRDESLKRMAGEAPGKAGPHPGEQVEPLSPEARQQILARHFSEASLRVIAAKRQEKPPTFHSTFFPDPAQFSLWHFHVQGYYPQVCAFLASTETNGWGIPMNVTMVPASELGQPADWVIAVLL